MIISWIPSGYHDFLWDFSVVVFADWCAIYTSLFALRIGLFRTCKPICKGSQQTGLFLLPLHQSIPSLPQRENISPNTCAPVVCFRDGILTLSSLDSPGGDRD